MKSNEKLKKKTFRELSKNALYCSGQIQEAAPHKTVVLRPLLPIWQTIKVRRTRRSRHCYRSKDEQISDIFMLTSTHGHTNIGWPAKTYINQFNEDTGCRGKDLQGVIADRYSQGNLCYQRASMMVIMMIERFSNEALAWWGWAIIFVSCNFL